MTLRVSGENMTVDKIAAIDFITIYAHDFGYCEYNLNGNNGFSFSEAASKRVLVGKAIKQLVLDGLVSAVQSKRGFTYEITPRGAQVCDEMTSDYSDLYIEMSQQVFMHIGNKSEVEILTFINRKAIHGKEE